MQLTPRARAGDAQPHLMLPGALIDHVQGQLAAMRDRELGRHIGLCERCGTPVRIEQHFTRQEGAIVHVRCRSTAR